METQEKSRLLKFLKLDSIIDSLTGLIETRVALAKLEIKEEVAKLGARIIAGVVLAFLLVLTIFFLSISIGALLNSLFTSQFVGYFIVTGFYLLVLVFLIVFKVHIWLQRKIEKLLIDTQATAEDEFGED